MILGTTTTIGEGGMEVVKTMGERYVLTLEKVLTIEGIIMKEEMITG